MEHWGSRCSFGFSEMAYVAIPVRSGLKSQVDEVQHQRQARSPVMSKDVILYLAGKYSENVAQYMSVEYTGQT